MQVAYMHEFLLPTGPQKEMTRGDIIQPISVHTGNEHVKPRQIPDANHANLSLSMQGKTKADSSSSVQDSETDPYPGA